MINWEAVPAADVASLHWDPSAVPTAGASLTRSASGTTYEALLDRLRGSRDYAASWIEIRRSFRSEDQQQLQAVRLVSRVLAEFVARCDGAACGPSRSKRGRPSTSRFFPTTSSPFLLRRERTNG